MAEDKKEPEVVYKNFRGKYNLDDIFRIRPTNEGVYLADSSNCFVDKTGGIRSREGFISRDSNSYHSVKRFGNAILGVVNENLSIIFISGNTITSSVLQYNVGNSRFNWTEAGSKIYGTNNVIFGYFDTTNNTWNTSLSISKTYHRIMPAGHLIERYYSRLLVAVGEYIVVSDPFSYHTYDTRNDKAYLKLKSRVKMIASVNGGFWTSDNEGIYFISGTKLSEWIRTPITSYSVIENCYAKGVGLSVRGKYYKECVFMTTQRGICLGSDGGEFINFTENNYEMIESSEGIGFLRKGTYNQYISISK